MKIRGGTTMKKILKAIFEFAPKLLDLVITGSLCGMAYLAFYQNNFVVKVLGVFITLQAAKIIYSRWFR